MRKIKYTKEQVERAINRSRSIRDVMHHLGMSVDNGHYRVIHYYAKLYGLELPKADPKARTRRAVLASKIPDELYFAKNTFHIGKALRKRLLNDHGRQEMCAICGIGPEWNGKFLRLHVDHVDGDKLNNLLSNLRFLCPNCHSQTSTYSNNGGYGTRYSYCKCGQRIARHSRLCRRCENERRGTKIEWPSDREILDLVEEYSMLEVGRRLGVSDNAVRKHLMRRGLANLRQRA